MFGQFPDTPYFGQLLDRDLPNCPDIGQTRTDFFFWNWHHYFLPNKMWPPSIRINSAHGLPFLRNRDVLEMKIVHTQNEYYRFLTTLSIRLCFFFAVEQRVSTCQAMCLNGGTCFGDKCVCRSGYKGDFCNERKISLSLFCCLLAMMPIQNKFQFFLIHHMIPSYCHTGWFWKKLTNLVSIWRRSAWNNANKLVSNVSSFICILF